MLEGKRAYMCSTLSDRQKKQRIHNIEMARFYLKRMEELYHCRTFASHAYLPLMLDDTISEERELALSIGKQFLDLCDVLIICGRRISSGMEGEIRHAFASGKEVYWYDGVRKPFELEQIREWKEIEYAVQIPENHISE